jgi:protease I
MKTQSISNISNKGKIGVLIEEHFDETEFRKFNELFPANGYEVEYISHLWNQEQATYKSNDLSEEVAVTVELNEVQPTDYQGILLIGAYAMDRLRYESNPLPGQPNQAPAVKFLRRAVEAMDANKLKIGTVCHSLWLFCAAPELLKNRQVTCAHNLIQDVQNAEGIVMFGEDGTKTFHVDGNLITGKHPNSVEEFINVFIQEMQSQKLQVVGK